METDLNAPRPIVAGGTGATSADGALFNLSGEKAAQSVTSYDAHLWVPGSFRSAAAAAGAPNATATFAGVAYINEPLANPPTNQNVVLEARDLTDGKLYVRRKTAGVWGAWAADVTIADVFHDNVVINGDFRVNQTGYVSAAVLSAGSYGHDQWKAGASGGNYSFTQLKSSTQITIAAGKSLIQPIEDVNVVGGSYVLSWTGTAQARAGVNTLTPSGAYAASPLLISGQTAGTVMSVEFNTGTLGTVKLESGSLITPFIMRPYDRELMACLRYYQKLGGTTAGDINLAGYAAAAGERVTTTLTYPTMKSLPTGIVVGTWGKVNVATVVISNAGISSMGFYLTGNGTGTAQLFTQNATTYITLDARL